MYTNWGPGSFNTNWGSGPVNTNWVPGPVNTNWGPGPAGKYKLEVRATASKHKLGARAGVWGASKGLGAGKYKHPENLKTS